MFSIDVSTSYEGGQIVIPTDSFTHDMVADIVNRQQDERVIENFSNGVWRLITEELPKYADRERIVDIAKESIMYKEDDYKMLEFMKFIHDTYEDLTRQT